jgi:hypothetical protein
MDLDGIEPGRFGNSRGPDERGAELLHLFHGEGAKMLNPSHPWGKSTSRAVWSKT